MENDEINQFIEFFNSSEVKSYYAQERINAQIQELTKLKIFNLNKVKEKENATYLPLFSNVLLLYSPIKDIRKVLTTISHACITDTDSNLSSFIMTCPTNQFLKNELYSLLSNNNIQINNKIKITSQTSYRTFFTKQDKKDKNLPKQWHERITYIQNLLQTIKQVTYTPAKEPQTFLFIPKNEEGKTSIELFLKNNSNYNLHDFYIERILIRHLLLSSNLLRQEQQQDGTYSLQTISISSKQLSALLPQRLSKETLLNYNNLCTIKKVKTQYLFTFSDETIEIFQSKLRSSQYIQLPLKLFKIFPKYLGHNSLKFLLAILYGYSNKYRKINYKISTILKLAELNTKRGNKYVIASINDKLQYLQSIKLIQHYIPITTEDLKKDKAITITLTPLPAFTSSLYSNDKE